MNLAAKNDISSTNLRGVFRSSSLKPWLALSAVVGLLAWGSAVSNAANILYNANLDIISTNAGQFNASADGWAIDCFKTISGAYQDGADSETWCNVADPGGYGMFFKPFAGSTNLVNDLVTVKFYQDNPTTAGTMFTFSGYAAGEANYCGFSPGTPTRTLFVVEFLDNTGAVLASNVLDLISAGLPNGGPASMTLFTMPQVVAPANTATVRAGAYMLDGYNTTVNPQNFFVDAFDLEAVAPPGSPTITNQPVSTTASVGGNASLTVGVSSATAVTYQWQFYNTNIANVSGHISGVQAATLNLTGVTASDVGHYRVLVSNSAGTVYSQDASVALLGLGFYPVVSVTGKVGDTYRIDYATKVDPTNWLPLSTITLTSATANVTDLTSPGPNARFYRAVFLH